MGLVRLLLAVSVLLGHAVDHRVYGFRMLDAGFAVEAFFMLSGFYMALILDGPYKGPRAYWLFLQNRLLRIFPMYWLTLLVTVPVVWYGATYINLPSRAGVLTNPFFTPPFSMLLDTPANFVPANLALLVSQVFILGQDLVYFVTISPAGLFAESKFTAQSNSIPLSLFLFVPQAWSLSFELTFYAMAPYLVRRHTRTIVALTAASLALCIGMALFTDLMGSASAFRFKSFPNEFWTFGAGILMFRATGYLKSINSRRVATAALAALIGVTLCYEYVPLMRNWVYLSLVFVLVPLAFLLYERDRVLGATERWLLAVDHYLGDLSYPVYIVHILVLYLMYTFWPGGVPRLGIHLLPVAVLATLLTSAALLRFVGEPIERLRVRNRDRLASGPDRPAARREVRAARAEAKRAASAPRRSR